MTTKRRSKRKATPEQIEAAKTRDAALATAADAALSEPDTVMDVANWLFTVTGTVRRFSLRNQTLLFNQAQERAVMPTDVRSFHQWRDAGRVPRKGTAYYLTVPKGEEAIEGQADEQPAENRNIGTGDGEEKATRTRFRTRPFWDITDTDGIEDLDDVEAVDQAAEPVDRAQAVWDRLAEQVADRDYTIQRDGDAHDVDHKTKTVTIASVVDGHTVDTRTAAAALGVQLAAIITHGWVTRTAPTAIAPVDLPEGVERIRLELGDHYGTATVDVSTNWDNGRTLYRIEAPRVHGAITVLPEEITYEHAVRPEGVDFHTGDYTTGSWPSDHRHKDAMHVNGIALSDGLRGLTFERVTGRGWNGHPWETRADRYVSRYQTRPAPDATSSRFSAVVRAVLLHWFARPDLAQVREVAAQLAAPGRKAEQDRKAAKLAEEIAELQERQRLHETQAAEFIPLLTPIENTPTEHAPAADETAELALF
jgi:hypothetical protein